MVATEVAGLAKMVWYELLPYERTVLYARTQRNVKLLSSTIVKGI